MDDSIIKQRISALFQSYFTKKILRIETLPGAGSSRKYFRIYSELQPPLLACFGTNIEENKTFIYFCSVFSKIGINVPQVVAAESSNEIYIVTDLGEIDVLTAKQNQTTEYTISIYQRILQDLIQIQLQGGKEIDFSKCFVRSEFDRTAMRWDLYYFKYYYLKISDLEVNEQKLEEDFDKILDFLDSADRQYFMYRDFQSRNILLKDNKLGYIDFQGGMKGPLQYDVVSLLYQAKANLSEQLRNELLQFYITELKKHIVIDEDLFIKQYQGFVFIRIIQTLGAYGYRGLIQRKEHFIQSIPQALKNLKQHTLIFNKIVSIPYLSNLINQLSELTIK